MSVVTLLWRMSAVTAGFSAQDPLEPFFAVTVGCLALGSWLEAQLFVISVP